MGGDASLGAATLRIGGTLALLAAALGLLYVAADIFLLAFLAALLALGLRGASHLLSAHTPLSPGWSLSVVALLLIGAVILGGVLMAPRLADQSSRLAEETPRILEQAKATLASHPLGEKALARMEEASPSMQNAGKYLARAAGAFTRTFGILANLLFVLALAAFLAGSPKLYIDPFLRLFPPRRRGRMADVLDQVGGTLRMWLLGRVLSMAIISVLTGLGLYFLGVPLALLLAVLAGLLNFIPNIGPALALVPALLLALPMGGKAMILVFALYTGVQFLESYVFTPVIQKKAVDMPPALLLLSQIVFGILFGFLGLLLSTPLTAAAIVLVRTLYVEDVLERPEPGG